MVKAPEEHPEIPQGVYCYTLLSVEINQKEGFKLNKKVCPYWSLDPERPSQENGYCSFLKKGDWELKSGLLWDQCKECGINDEVEEVE